MGSQRSQVVGVVVHVVTVAGLSGASVPAPVVGDDAVAVAQEEQHLVVPIVGRKRPAMAENDRLARTPILEKDLRAIGRSDRAHALLPPLVWTLTPKRANRQPKTKPISGLRPVPVAPLSTLSEAWAARCAARRPRSCSTGPCSRSTRTRSRLITKAM